MSFSRIRLMLRVVNGGDGEVGSWQTTDRRCGFCKHVSSAVQAAGRAHGSTSSTDVRGRRYRRTTYWLRIPRSCGHSSCSPKGADKPLRPSCSCEHADDDVIVVG